MHRTEYLGELDVIVVHDDKGRVYVGYSLDTLPLLEAAVDAMNYLDVPAAASA